MQSKIKRGETFLNKQRNCTGIVKITRLSPLGRILYGMELMYDKVDNKSVLLIPRAYHAGFDPTKKKRVDRKEWYKLARLYNIQHI